MNDNVKKIILDTIKKYNYSSIILFGSRARNDYKDNSDYDLLLVVQDVLSVQEMRKMQVSIRKELALQGIDADVIVKTKHIVEEYRTRKGNIIYNALKEGVVLWVIDSLTDYAVDLRYPDTMYVPTIEETKEAVELMNKIIKDVKNTLNVL